MHTPNRVSEASKHRDQDEAARRRTLRNRRGWTFAACAVILAVGAAVRLLTWNQVFTSHGLRLNPDGDPYYHALRAQRIALEGRVDWFDGGINFPRGAEVPWPPLFDALIAGSAWIAAPTGPNAETVERVAAVVPLVLGLATIAVVALLAAEIFGSGAGLGAALVLALSPAHTYVTVLGRADQHAMEALLVAAILLPFVRALRSEAAARRTRLALYDGVLLALSFWVWLGSALYLVSLSLFAGAWHVAAPSDEDRRRSATTLAFAASTAALLLALSIIVLGPPGALTSLRVTGVSALSVVLCAADAVGAALLALAVRYPGGRLRRGAEALVVAAAVGGVLLATPALRSGIAHGLEGLRRGNPWYELIDEFRPLVFSGHFTVRDEVFSIFTVFGLVPLAVFAAAPSLIARAHAEPQRRAGLFLAAATGVIFLALAVARRRMEMYAALPLALLGPEGIGHLVHRLAPGRRPWATAAAYVLMLGPCVPGHLELLDVVDPEREVAIRIGSRLRDASMRSGEPGAILGPWDRGHHLRYFSGLPVLTSPFGTEGGEGAMEEAARFYRADTPERAEAVLARHAIRWIVLENLQPELFLAARFSPDGEPALPLARSFPGVVPSPQVARLVSVRLYYRDGNAGPGGPALTGFRLVDEDSITHERPVKVFERVPGAQIRVEGASPSSTVEAQADVTLPSGRRLAYGVRAFANSDGRAMLRLPYATGANGRARASAWMVSDGRKISWVRVSDAAVLGGEALPLRLR